MYSVLVVDDEPLTREYLRANIPSFDGRWRVAGTAADGREALDALEREPVHLIITDIKMPVMDGLALCREVAKRPQPRPRIVILSGYDEFSLAKEAIRYGVNDYLLKPIVREELTETLGKIASELEREEGKRLAAEALKNASQTSRELIAKQFLQAVVSDSNVEIKALYPVVFRLKINLLEELGAVMLVLPDVETVLEKPIPPRDITVYRLLLHQIVTEIAERDGSGTVFFDRRQHTAVLVGGGSEEEIEAKCRSLYERVSETIRKHAGMTVTGALGTCETDVLQLNASYRRARDLLDLRILRGRGAFYLPRTFPDGAEEAERKDRLERALAAVKSGLLEGSEVQWRSAVRQFAALVEPPEPIALYRYGAYLIDRLSDFLSPVPGETEERALVRLQQAGSALRSGPSEPDAEAIAGHLVDIIRLFARDEAQNLEPDGGRPDIVARAKAYIMEHYAEPISLALVAERIGVSAAYLSSQFQKSGSESYIKFLTRIRMEQAAKLLRANPAEKIYDVAEKVGYVSVKHFSYVFKQHFQMTPGEYQEACRAKPPQAGVLPYIP